MSRVRTARSRTMALVVAGHPSLLVPYHVVVVNPNKGGHINQVGAQALADFLLSEEAQGLIASFGIDRFGQPLFRPASDLPAELELTVPG